MFEFDAEKFVEIRENSGRFIFYKFINDNLDKFGKNIIRSLRDESAQMIDSFFENSKNISPEDLSLKAGKIARKILDSSSVVTVRSIELLKKSLLLTEKKEREKEEREKDKVMKKMAKIEEKMNEKIMKMKNKKEILQRLLDEGNSSKDSYSKGNNS
jgi:Mg2+ and Co2+ transporter CorA